MRFRGGAFDGILDAPHNLRTGMAWAVSAQPCTAAMARASLPRQVGLTTNQFGIDSAPSPATARPAAREDRPWSARSRRRFSSLRLGEGDVFHGEGILAVTKALLQSGVAISAAIQGAPVSHLIDVLVDAKDILDELGVHFETCANEAGAAAMLGASINYPMRGAVDLEIDRRHQRRVRRAVEPRRRPA